MTTNKTHTQSYPISSFFFTFFTLCCYRGNLIFVYTLKMFTTWVIITTSKCCRHHIMMKQNNIKWLDPKKGPNSLLSPENNSYRLSYRGAVECFSLVCLSNSSLEPNSNPSHKLHLNGSSIDIIDNLVCILFITFTFQILSLIEI